MRQKATAKRFESPHYIEIDEVANRTTILTGGLPFHRLVGRRMLDSLLVVHGERCRHFRLGIGVDLKHPLQEALSLLTPETAVCQSAAPPSPADSSWLFHVDSRNVIATHWSPLIEGDDVKGFRVRLLETGGRAAKTKLSSFRPVSSARQVDFCGASQADCKLADGQIELALGAHEWVEVEARW
jgi:alpha-mannosidase